MADSKGSRTGFSLANTRSQIPQRVPALFLAGVVLIAAVYFGFDRHEASSLKKTAAATATQHAKLAQLQSQLNATVSNPNYLNTLYQKAQQGSSLLPPSPSADFFTTLSNDAASAGLGSPSFSNSAAQSGPGGLSFVQYSVTVTGTLDQVTGFMTKLQADAELVTVNNAKVTGSGGKFTAGFVVDVWASGSGASSSASPAASH